MRYKLGKNRKLKKRADISCVFEKGIRVWNSHMTLIALPQQENLEKIRLSRVCAAVSKKHGNAVQRNRIKRLYRETTVLIDLFFASASNSKISSRIKGSPPENNNTGTRNSDRSFISFFACSVFRTESLRPVSLAE